MLHLVVLTAGLAGVWLLLVPSVAWLGAGLAALALTLLLASRLNVADRESADYRSCLQIFALAPIGARWRGAGRIARAGVFGAQRLSPALARYRTRPASEAARAGFAATLSTLPGLVALQSAPDSILLHTANEDALDARALSAAEARIVAAIDGERAR